jgi:hypothetical protein
VTDVTTGENQAPAGPIAHVIDLALDAIEHGVVHARLPQPPVNPTALPSVRSITRRRRYIPEGAGRGQGAVVPVFGAFPGRVLGMPGGGPGPDGAPGWTNDLEAGPPPGSDWTRPVQG